MHTVDIVVVWVWLIILLHTLKIKSRSHSIIIFITVTGSPVITGSFGRSQIESLVSALSMVMCL